MLDISCKDSLSFEIFKDKVSKYKFLKEWKSIYLLVLIIVTEDLKEISDKEKILNILNFMYSKYQIRLAIVIFILYHFSNKRLIPNSNKFRKNRNWECNKRNLENMTWDLYFLTEANTKLQNTNMDAIFATNDKSLNGMLQFLTCLNSELIEDNCQMRKMFESINGKEIFDYFTNLCFRKDDKTRMYNQENFTYEYRDSLIRKYEHILKEISDMNS